MYLLLSETDNSYEMNTENIKDNNYIQMQITSIEDECYIRHCTRLFHILTFEVGISHVYWKWINGSPVCLSDLIEAVQLKVTEVKFEYRSSDSAQKGSFDYTIGFFFHSKGNTELGLYIFLDQDQ